MDLDALTAHRHDHDRFLAEHYASPLPEEYQDGFGGLDYFPPDPAWRVRGRFVAAADERVAIRSTAGSVSDYTVAGTVTLEIGGTECRWVVLDDGDGGRFLPFRDATAGTSTYAGGRYVEVEVAADGSAVIDFNRAANPYCVYDEEFACPLPPPQNVTSIPIAAGEKVWTPPR